MIIKSTIVRVRTPGVAIQAATARLAVAIFLGTLILSSASRAGAEGRDRDGRSGGKSPTGAADVNRGVRLARIGASAQTLAALERAARRSPDLAEAHLNRGLMLAQAGRQAEAQAAFGRALTLEPGMAEALEGLALSLLLEGRNKPAAATYERVIWAGAGTADTHYNFAIALARSGEPEAATRECREAVRLRPGMQGAQALLRGLQR